jgi:hypothetical protein
LRRKRHDLRHSQEPSGGPFFSNALSSSELADNL